jgi:hypothetical protein
MKSIALTAPDDPAEMPKWLDQQLVGTDLGQLVAELKTIHRSTTGGPSLNQLLGDSSGRVLQDGLTALPVDQLKQLLQHPNLLLDLQEQVLLQGGFHWRNLTANSQNDNVVSDGLKKVQAVWSIPMPASQRRSLFTHPAIVSFATAAAVMLAVSLFSDSFRTKPIDEPVAKSEGIGWGWAKAGTIRDDLSAKDYLNSLANGAEEWSKKTPTEAVALAKRINEFRTGCTTLIFSPHKPLGEADRKWLVERCRVWGERLDKQLQAIESGKPMLDVLGTVDEIAVQMAQSLKARAGAV